MEVVGILKNARRVPKGEDVRAPCLSGDVYGDTKGRFHDGERITTSTIMSEEGDVFRTRFSVYRVESWAAPKSANDNADLAKAVSEIVSRCHIASSTAGWWSEADRANPYTVACKLALIHSEISEAMEGDRKKAMDDKLPHRKMVEVELADALIRIADLAGWLGLDLGGAVVEKMAFNAKRADHKVEARNASGGKAY